MNEELETKFGKVSVWVGTAGEAGTPWHHWEAKLLGKTVGQVTFSSSMSCGKNAEEARRLLKKVIEDAAESERGSQIEGAYAIVA